MIDHTSPEFHMKSALFLAEKGRFTVSPNPMVGCIIVKEQKIIGTGFHQRAGEPHAEVFALKEAGENAKGADVYVTLEPCCHQGRTPPCTDALIQSGVKRVFIACLDPNPLVAGKGIEALNQAGIETFVGILEHEAKALNKVFFHFIAHKRPFVIAKWAMSLDGKTITHPEDSRIISDDACHQHAHEVRQGVDAILIGSKTAILDNPRLTARKTHEIMGGVFEKRRDSDEGSVEAMDGRFRENAPHNSMRGTITHPKQPLRIILASRGELALDLAIFSPDLPGKTLVVVTELADKTWIERAKEKNITVWILPANAAQKVDIPTLLNKLGEANITSLLVEGGEEVRNAFFRVGNGRYINEIQTYISPVFIGDLEKKLRLSSLQSPQILGESLCLVASLKP